MSDTHSDEKPYPPTPQKLKKARDKGEVARSIDLTTAASYLGLLVALATLGPTTLSQFGNFAQGLLRSSAVQFEKQSLTPILKTTMWKTAEIFAPWFVISAVFVLILLIGKRAIVFTPSKLQFKGNRINPVENAKNKYGRSGLFEFAKSFTKLLVFCVCLALFLSSNTQQIVGSSALSAHGAIAMQLETVLRLVSVVVIVAIIIGAIDYIWQYGEHLRKNRMTHKELMDESKESEGDPELKQKRRQKAQEVATSQLMTEIPNADVIIVNPTHYAVALKWERDKPEAPRCIAKGVDEIAKRIRQVAQENAVPIHSDPPIARALFSDLKIGQEIQLQHYQAVAAAIRFADNMKNKRWSTG